MASNRDRFHRRIFLKAIGVPVAATLSGCSYFRSNAPQFRLGGFPETDEPLIENADASINEAYPFQYFALVRSTSESESVRWEYLQRSDPVFANKLEKLDFDRSFLVIIGMVLPSNLTFGQVDSQFESKTMYISPEIVEANTDSDRIRILNIVQQWLLNGATPPREMVVDYRFSK